VVDTHGAHIQATLSGYAYDTTPNHFVITGQTSGPDAASNVGGVVSSLPENAPSTFASLGRLAQGAAGITAWKREEEVLAN
jgi:hypothetical protein